ncbi:MAG: iron-sulfur cluster assembly scaffold protein [Myxococcales bacterium]|nr:iron-sulfur cluster assembly scaffold protein [Myxococcales bacterium]
MSGGPYDDWVLQHSKQPQNRGPLADATHQARVDNPLCGDRVTVALIVQDDAVEQVRFEARACAICVAAASHLTTVAQGASLEQVHAWCAEVDQATDPDAADVTGPIEPLMAARRFVARRRCATLPWEALEAALKT